MLRAADDVGVQQEAQHTPEFQEQHKEATQDVRRAKGAPEKVGDPLGKDTDNECRAERLACLSFSILRRGKLKGGGIEITP